MSNYMGFFSLQGYITLAKDYTKKDKDLPGGVNRLFKVIYYLFVNIRCRDLLLKANIFLNWFHRTRNLSADISGVHMTHIGHVLVNPKWGMKFKRQLALQFAEKGLDSVVNWMDEASEKGTSDATHYALMPLLFLGQFKDIGSEWLANNYHRLLPFVDAMEEELDNIAHYFEVDGKRTKLWDEFKKRICHVQEVWSNRHAEELIALEAFPVTVSMR